MAIRGEVKQLTQWRKEKLDVFLKCNLTLYSTELLLYKDIRQNIIIMTELMSLFSDVKEKYFLRNEILQI